MPNVICAAALAGRSDIPNDHYVCVALGHTCRNLPPAPRRSERALAVSGMWDGWRQSRYRKTVALCTIAFTLPTHGIRAWYPHPYASLPSSWYILSYYGSLTCFYHCRCLFDLSLRPRSGRPQKQATVPSAASQSPSRSTTWKVYA